MAVPHQSLKRARSDREREVYTRKRLRAPRHDQPPLLLLLVLHMHQDIQPEEQNRQGHGKEKRIGRVPKDLDLFFGSDADGIPLRVARTLRLDDVEQRPSGGLLAELGGAHGDLRDRYAFRGHE